MRFVLGSHRLDMDYSAIDFFSKDKKNGHRDPAPPQWHEMEGDHQIAIAPVEPGDCVIFDYRMHHSAPGNLQKNRRRRVICTHWFGDGARYHDKSWECSPNERGEGLVHGGTLECETFPRVH